MDIFRVSDREEGLSPEEIRSALLEALAGRSLKKVLILPPDFTRFHSNAGYITNVCYHELTDRGVHVDIMPALGTHAPMTIEQIQAMYGDIPPELFLVHDWRHNVVRLGEVPGDYIAAITDGLWTDPVSVEVNRRIMDEIPYTKLNGHRTKRLPNNANFSFQFIEVKGRSRDSFDQLIARCKALLRRVVASVDPQATIVVSKIHEAFGNGFEQI